jgi:transcriptional regulator with XRE-family HTH domain
MLTVGKILKKEREKKGLKLSDIEKSIKVRSKYLSAIEHDDWSLFSSKIYITGIIRNYSKELGIEPEKMITFFRREYAKKEDTGFRKNLTSKYFTPQTVKIIYYLIVLFILLFTYYFGFQVKRYLSPPKIEILSPDKNTFKRQDKIHVIGKTEKEAVIKVFGERVYQNEKGVFSYDLPLKKGENKLKIEIIGANGKRTIIEKTYYLKL